MDTVNKNTRSYIMSRVRRKDTGPEITLRSELHRFGLRYRLHDKKLPGSPDLVFPRFRAVIFVHGCYWHSHGCYRSTVPKTRRKFWTDKFHTNRLRDINAVRLLIQEGWRVLTVWECAISGKTSRSSASIVQEVKLWLDSPENLGVITGTGFF